MVGVIEKLRTHFINDKNVENIYFEKYNGKLVIAIQVKDVSKIGDIPSEFEGFDLVITDKVDTIFEHE